ncbi:hypothetical protein ILUMI_10902 [Ignelater luminosus]|uniref:SANT domain-containing protein n=1 Tax=Ignelater luminosus TaxID=2038154 RepID=A0A8K0GDQ9_IGNLU|nr:hypothetical protein ILUMI_10902 [Ignelater luminosus]
MLASWTDKEKFQLLHSLKKHGSGNVKIVAKEIPTKSLHEVEYAISVYSSAARKSLKVDNKSRYRQAPIDKWIQFVKRHTLNVRRSRDLATVLKIFAFHEKPLLKQSDEINFEDLYLFLANLSLGNAPKQLNYKTHMFLMKTISELARKCKRETTDRELNFVANLNSRDNYRRTTFKEDDDLEVDERDNDAVEFLKHNLVMNPLKIGRSFLENRMKQGEQRLGTAKLKLRKLANAMKRRLV